MINQPICSKKKTLLRVCIMSISEFVCEFCIKIMSGFTSSQRTSNFSHNLITHCSNQYIYLNALNILGNSLSLPVYMFLILPFCRKWRNINETNKCVHIRIFVWNLSGMEKCKSVMSLEVLNGKVLNMNSTYNYI